MVVFKTRASPSIPACSLLLPIDSRPRVVLRVRSAKGGGSGGSGGGESSLELSASPSRAGKADRRARSARRHRRPSRLAAFPACPRECSYSRVVLWWRDSSHRGSQAGGLRQPRLFEAQCLQRRIETRAKKRKRELELLRTALEGAIVESPQAVPISVRGGDLESGEGSSDFVTSDVGSAKAAADDVVHVAHALRKVCAKSPKAVIDFVRRVSPATVGRSIDWDLVRDPKSSKMSDGRQRWTDLEVRVFLESCLEEMAAYNITSNTPKAQAWENLVIKMYTKCRKKTTSSGKRGYPVVV
uniref:Myb/SANT-like domain-containing protein n=1 Tax=Oryza punctata TaxID=4537 RepID=A0A0E0KP17_ORYPU